MKFNKKTFFPFLGLGIIAFILSVLVVIYINPNEPLLIGSIYINPVILLFTFIFITLSAIGGLILRSLRRGILLGILVILILFLQYIHINSALYSLILILLIILIDIYFKKKS